MSPEWNKDTECRGGLPSWERTGPGESSGSQSATSPLGVLFPSRLLKKDQHSDVKRPLRGCTFQMLFWSNVTAWSFKLNYEVCNAASLSLSQKIYILSPSSTPVPKATFGRRLERPSWGRSRWNGPLKSYLHADAHDALRYANGSGAHVLARTTRLQSNILLLGASC